VDICSAIIELTKDSETGSASVSVNAEDYSQITWHDSNPNNITVDQIKAKQAELKAAYDAKEYQRKREKEYPSIPDQLDDLYHNGIDGWKTTIKVTKDKYPKP
jgi:hypothetical protein